MIVFSTARELNILIFFKKCHQNSQNTGIYINYKLLRSKSKSIDWFLYDNSPGHESVKFMATDCNFVPQPLRMFDDVSFNRPNNLAELRTFWGMTAYCRKIIVDFSNRAACLHDLLEKG